MFEKIADFCDIANNWITLKLRYFYENQKIEKFLFALVILLILVGMYILNHYTTLIVDDYGYSFSLGHRTKGIMDILESQYNHYFAWGGRVVVHTIAQFFLMFDKKVFDIANTFAYLAMVLVVYFHAVGSFKPYPLLLLLINLLFFLCMPAFGQVFLWVVGACNYLWGPLLVFSYLIPYRIQYSKDTPVIDNKILCVIFGLLGIIAGWTNENMGLTLAFVILVFMYLYWLEHKKIYLWCMCGFIGALIGAIALILAPGNFARLEIGHMDINFFKNLIAITKMFLQTKFLLIPISLFLILSVLVKKNTDFKIVTVYILGLLVSMYAMAGAPYYADRAKLGSLAFLTIACCNLYTNLDFSVTKLRKVIAILGILIIGVTYSEYKIARSDIKDYKLRNDAKVEHVLKEKALGNLDIIVKPNYPKTRYAAPYGLEDISKDVKHWTNKGFARYYGVKSVKIE
ncbi:MAG: hypothetical protein DBY32_04795 [Phascolarctobacterium sp.]|nr:MAG: hypothetical protein DBY32_04795 [Phascolarctobacterium sp.]